MKRHLLTILLICISINDWQLTVVGNHGTCYYKMQTGIRVAGIYLNQYESLMDLEHEKLVILQDLNAVKTNCSILLCILLTGKGY